MSNKNNVIRVTDSEKQFIELIRSDRNHDNSYVSLLLDSIRSYEIDNNEIIGLVRDFNPDSVIVEEINLAYIESLKLNNCKLREMYILLSSI